MNNEEPIVLDDNTNVRIELVSALEDLLELTNGYDDVGPSNEGWASEELKAAIAKAEKLISEVKNLNAKRVTLCTLIENDPLLDSCVALAQRIMTLPGDKRGKFRSLLDGVGLKEILDGAQ